DEVDPEAPLVGGKRRDGPPEREVARDDDGAEHDGEQGGRRRDAREEENVAPGARAQPRERDGGRRPDARPEPPARARRLPRLRRDLLRARHGDNLLTPVIELHRCERPRLVRREPRYDVPKKAPGSLRIVQEFLNTRNDEA